MRASLSKSRNALRYSSHRTICTMSSSTGNLGDAVRSDGMLKDASEIVWSYDADDSIPFPSGSASVSHNSHPTSASRRASATVVAAVRRTTRVSRLSRRFLEEDLEAELPKAPTCKSSGGKRKAASALPNRRAKCKTIDVVSDGDCDGESDGGTSLPPPTELASDDYESLKAMADADNQVCASHFPLIFIIFSSQLRLRSPNPGRSVLPTYASCSTMRRTTSIQSPGSVWMVTGARFASQTLLSRNLHVS